MKAITLIQPWASLIALGEKQFETRSWPTSYRGPIAIHAGRRTKQAEEFIRNMIDACPSLFYHQRLYRVDDFPFGSIIAIGILKGCYRTSLNLPNVTIQELDLGDWSTGRWAWRIEDVRALETPVHVRGAQGIWEVPNDLLERLK
jgi:hypothetical protein